MITMCVCVCDVISWSENTDGSVLNLSSVLSVNCFELNISVLMFRSKYHNCGLKVRPTHYLSVNTLP